MCELLKAGMLDTHADSCRFCFSSLYALQIQMYQLSRLLHDYHRELYNHLEENEISPSLYAAPWFLTLFASQFPLGFVARVFGKRCLFSLGTVLAISQRSLSMKSPQGQESPKYYSNAMEKSQVPVSLCIFVWKTQKTEFSILDEGQTVPFSGVLFFWVFHFSSPPSNWIQDTEKGTQPLCYYGCCVQWHVLVFLLLACNVCSCLMVCMVTFTGTEGAEAIPETMAKRKISECRQARC